jgi:hypothetical protein
VVDEAMIQGVEKHSDFIFSILGIEKSDREYVT